MNPVRASGHSGGRETPELTVRALMKRGLKSGSDVPTSIRLVSSGVRAWLGRLLHVPLIPSLPTWSEGES